MTGAPLEPEAGNGAAADDGVVFSEPPDNLSQGVIRVALIHTNHFFKCPN